MDEYKAVPGTVVWDELLKALETAGQCAETLRRRSIDVWLNPEYRRLMVKLPAKRRTLVEPTQGEQLMMLGFGSLESDVREVSEAELLRELQLAVRKGTARKRFPVGTLIADSWTDTATGRRYDSPLIIVEYRDVQLKNGGMRLGAILLRQKALPIRVQFDASDTANPYGDSRYAGADVWQWLNSELEKGKWWNPQHTDDVMPKYAREKDGYMRGCSEKLREVLTEITLEVPAIVGGEARKDLVDCWWYLPTMEELNYETDDQRLLRGELGIARQSAWEYFRGTPAELDVECERRVFRDHEGVPQRCLTRSVYRMSNESYVWAVTPDGSADHSSAYGKHNTVAPACVVA